MIIHVYTLTLTAMPFKKCYVYTVVKGHVHSTFMYDKHYFQLKQNLKLLRKTIKRDSSFKQTSNITQVCYYMYQEAYNYKVHITIVLQVPSLFRFTLHLSVLVLNLLHCLHFQYHVNFMLFFTSV